MVAGYGIQEKTQPILTGLEENQITALDAVMVLEKIMH
jgi:hypothetical protein